MQKDNEELRAITSKRTSLATCKEALTSCNGSNTLMSSKLKIKLLETQSYRNVLIFGQSKSVMLGQGPEWENLG